MKHSKRKYVRTSKEERWSKLKKKTKEVNLRKSSNGMSDVLKEKNEMGRERRKTRWGVKRKINK